MLALRRADSWWLEQDRQVLSEMREAAEAAAEGHRFVHRHVVNPLSLARVVAAEAAEVVVVRVDRVEA